MEDAIEEASGLLTNEPGMFYQWSAQHIFQKCMTALIGLDLRHVMSRVTCQASNGKVVTHPLLSNMSCADNR
jgi:hypothetical protein